VVEDVEFRAEDIDSVLRALILNLLQLQSAVQELDSKQTVLATLVALLHGTHERVRPLIPELVPVLQQLWAYTSASQPVFRGAVMQALTEIIEVVEVSSADLLASVAVPMIREAVVGNNADSLLDEGLAMLRATLDSVRALSPLLLQAFEFLVSVFIRYVFVIFIASRESDQVS
jgi:hypothetical protein